MTCIVCPTVPKVQCYLGLTAQLQCAPTFAAAENAATDKAGMQMTAILGTSPSSFACSFSR